MKPVPILEAPGRTRSRSLLSRVTQKIEKSAPLDPAANVLSGLSEPLAVPVLRGNWLGHALHPMLTDIPIGLWTASTLLDLVGGKASRPAARSLVGMGLLAAVPTAAAGLAEWKSLPDRAARRVATVHAAGNVLAMGLYLGSWLSRRRGSHTAGAVLGLTGGLLAAGTGYLGGHLSFALGVGTGERDNGHR